MKSFRLNRAGVASKASLTPRFVLLALTAAVAAALMMPASASAAFSVSSFSVASSNKQAAGHPNVSIQVGKGGTTNEGLKNMVIDLPPGLLGDPEGPTSKCSNLLFSWDLCPSASHVGSIKVAITALGFLPMNVDGTVDVLTASSSSAVTLGITLRPIGSALGILSKVYQRDEITVRSATDYGLRNVTLNFPTTSTAIGIIPVPITINSITLNLQGKSNTSNNGRPFMIQPSLCQSATANVTLTSVQNVSASRSAVFAAPTGCTSVPFNPTIGLTVTDPTANAFTAGTLTLNVPQAAATIQNSTVDDAQFRMPLGSGLNFPLLSTFTECTEAQLSANACPVGSRIGTAVAKVPILPPDFTGYMYAMKIGSQIDVAVRLNGPRTQYAILRGMLEVQGSGATSRVVINADNNPQFPISQLRLTFTQPLVKNPNVCGPNTVESTISGHSGAVRNPTTTFSTSNCAPVVTISGPEGPTGDSTPTYTFTADQATAGFEVSIDGGAFAEQTSPYTTPVLADGSHTICVRGNNGSNTGEQACKSIIVDTVNPTVTINSPAEGVTIGASGVNVAFSISEPATATCKIDTEAAVPCDSTSSHTFAGLADGAHTAVVTATDAAGNPGSATVNFTVSTSTGWTGDTVITGGPRGGLVIDDTTPTFTFDSNPTGAPAYQCQIDSGAFAACGSPLTLPVQGNGSHTLSVRAGDGTIWDSTPATANFVVAPFAPDVTTAFSNTTAAANPNVSITLNSPSGDLKDGAFSLPDGFWGSRRAVPLCSTADADAGTCPAASQVGTAAFSTVTDANAPVDFTANVYLAEGTSGKVARLTAQGAPSVGGSFQANLSFDMRSPLDPGETIDVENPKGLDTVADNFPNQTSTGVALHTRALTLSLVGAGDPDYAAPLLYAPSNCDPDEVFVDFTSYEGNPGSDSVPYQATGCASLPFNPGMVQSYSTVARNTNNTVTVVTSVPPNHSSIKNLQIDMPLSIIPQYAGLAVFCTSEEVQQVPPQNIYGTCDPADTLAGTASIDTPLLPNGSLNGEVYLEDSGGTLPFLHIRIHNAALGVEVRLRALVETVGSPAHLRVSVNSREDSSLANIPDIPLNSLTISLPGTANYGPITKVSSQCRKTDSAVSTVNGWAGPSAAITQNFTFDSACPN